MSTDRSPGERPPPILIVPSTPPPKSRPRKAKLYERTANAPAIRLEDRDLHILEAAATHRFLSGDQLRRLFFQCSAAMVRRRLRALYDHGLLGRLAIMGQPSRGIPGYVYVLGKNGRTALAQEGIASSVDSLHVAKARVMRHRYLLNEFYVTLMEATRGTAYQVQRWQAEEALLVGREEGRGVVEQVTHRRLARPASFLPDAFFELDLGNGQSFAFFVEVDLATHPQRVWRHRARLYAAYGDPEAGLFRRRFGRENFRLLIITTPDFHGRSRRDNILASIRGEIGSTDMFLATTLPDMVPSRLLGPVWRRADNTQQMYSLVPIVRVRTLSTGGADRGNQV